jgi:hypothetical protein
MKRPILYEGEWINGIFRQGRRYNDDGSIFEGKWDEKTYLIKGIHVDSYGCVVYDGEWKAIYSFEKKMFEPYRHGYGKLFWPGERAEIGDKITYSGKLLKYEGEFRKNNRHGLGVYHNEQGIATPKCMWDNNVRLQEGCIVEDDPEDIEKAIVYRTYIKPEEK